MVPSTLFEVITETAQIKGSDNSECPPRLSRTNRAEESGNNATRIKRLSGDRKTSGEANTGIDVFILFIFFFNSTALIKWRRSAKTLINIKMIRCWGEKIWWRNIFAGKCFRFSKRFEADDGLVLTQLHVRPSSQNGLDVPSLYSVSRSHTFAWLHYSKHRVFISYGST